jgi:hypothetical protein
VQVDDLPGVLDRLLGQLGDPACAGESLVDGLAVRADVVDQADLGGPPGRYAISGQGVLLRQNQAGQQRPGDS